MMLESALWALAFVVVIFAVAYALLTIHMHGFHLGRHSAWESFTMQRPTDPSMPEKRTTAPAPKVVDPNQPPVYSVREEMHLSEGPMSEVAPFEETPLSPIGG